MSKTKKELFKKGLLKGWQSRNIESYAEKIWNKVLIEEIKIPFIREKVIHKRDLGLNDTSNYFLDFYFEINGNKIDFEVDGKQHKYPDRQQSDLIRDKLLKENGYNIYRIDWVNPVHDKDLFNKQKQNLKDYLNSFI